MTNSKFVVLVSCKDRHWPPRGAHTQGNQSGIRNSLLTLLGIKLDNLGKLPPEFL